MLHVENLTISCAGYPLLSNLCFSLQSGQGLHLTGDNGIGKTVLIKTLVGVHNFYEGLIETNANVSTTYIGVEMPFDPELTIWENLEYLGYFEKSTIPLDRLGKFFEVQDYAYQKFKDLSWGQKQRVNLTRLFLVQTSLWILDEPFQHLDNRFQGVLKDFLRKHIKKGGAVLMADHCNFMAYPSLELKRFLSA